MSYKGGLVKDLSRNSSLTDIKLLLILKILIFT